MEAELCRKTRPPDQSSKITLLIESQITLYGEKMLSRYLTIGENKNTSPEAELVKAAQRGDVGAFNLLVLSYQNRIYSLAVRLLDDHAAADDITQDAFLTAYLKLHNFRNGSFSSWIYRIATNLCYDVHRQRKRYQVLPLEDKETNEEKLLPLYDFPGNRALPEKEFERRELEQVIQNALRQLDPDQRAVVVLVDMEQFDYQEAADILRIPIGTVKSRLARGRLRLRQLLGGSALPGYDFSQCKN